MNSLDRVRSRLLYLMKPPLKRYRAYASPGDGTATWFQRKDRLRPGEMARIMTIMARIDIDALCIAGGAGVVMQNAVLDGARRWLKRSEEKKATRMGQMLGV